MPRVAERVAFHVPPEVEPQNLVFDVSEFPRSSPNPVASVFGDCEIIQKAAVRRGYPVMRSRFLNFRDDIHDQPENESRMRFNEFHPDFGFWHFQAAFGRPFSTMPLLSLRVRERHSWNGWCPCAKCRKQLGTCFSWRKSCGRLELESSLNGKISERSLLV